MAATEKTLKERLEAIDNVISFDQNHKILEFKYDEKIFYFLKYKTRTAESIFYYIYDENRKEFASASMQPVNTTTACAGMVHIQTTKNYKSDGNPASEDSYLEKFKSMLGGTVFKLIDEIPAGNGDSIREIQGKTPLARRRKI